MSRWNRFVKGRFVNGFVNQRKAQLEMIGLVIIVIIVITALLIFTVYKLTTPNKNIQKTYLNKETAINFLVSIGKINVKECHDLKLSEIIAACAGGSPVGCYDYTSCEMANMTLADILNQTLVEWGVSFNLSIEGTEISFANLDCDSKATEQVQGFEQIPLNPGSVEMTLTICSG
jgi:hypothetical protein